MIYLDHAATTPVDKQVYEAMKPYFTEKYGNPSSIYELGQISKNAIEEAREKVANLIGAKVGEIIFTSGATESNNLAIKGIAFSHRLTQISKKIDTDFVPHIITSSIEHHSVLDTVEHLEKEFGFEATYLPVDKDGLVNVEDLKGAIKENTVLVSIMHANNEVGTIQPIGEIGETIRELNKKRENKIVFHTDAVQSYQYLDIDVDKLNVDMLSLTGHKFYGPKGVGVLYIKDGTKFLPRQQGGAQERKRRAGTENVPYIIGMAKAMGLVAEEREESGQKAKKLRGRLIDGITENISDTILVGHKEKCLPHNAAFCFKFVEGESILINLDMEGVAASSGSACTSGSLEPSHVLIAMGYDHAIAHGSIRFTLGKQNTEENIDKVIEVLPRIIKRLRKMSPLKEEK